MCAEAYCKINMELKVGLIRAEFSMADHWFTVKKGILAGLQGIVHNILSILPKLYSIKSEFTHWSKSLHTNLIYLVLNGLGGGSHEVGVSTPACV